MLDTCLYFIYAGLTAKAASESLAPVVQESDPAEIPAILARLDTHLKTLHASLPPRTALMIFTGHSDPRHMVVLNARKSTFETALRGGKTTDEIGKDLWWTTSDARELEEEVEKAKRGLLFLAIK